MKMKNYLVIMAGGVGSRFWPASREERPKQFLDILGIGTSLLRSTFERFLPVILPENIYVVTHIKYKNQILEQLPELGDDQIICEPSRNNTAPCVAYAALKIHNQDSDANVIVSPADHVILKESEFAKVIQRALTFTAENNAIVTLGITPSRPDTGYGYIEMKEQDDLQAIRKAVRFTEKPTLDVARSYVEQGCYVWNSGLFIFKTKTIISAFDHHAPEILELLGNDNVRYNTPEERANIDNYYPRTPKISIDYAIMEKADNIYTIPADIGWSDLGTWKSLFEECPKDSHNNVIQADQCLLDNTSNSLIIAPKDKLVVVSGLDDFLVIDQDDVLVIYPKDREQEIKSIRDLVKSNFGDKLL